MLSGLLCTCGADPHGVGNTSAARPAHDESPVWPWASKLLGLMSHSLGARQTDVQGYNIQGVSGCLLIKGILTQTIPRNSWIMETPLCTIWARRGHRILVSPTAPFRPCRCHCRVATWESCRRWSRRSLRRSNTACTQTNCFLYDPSHCFDRVHQLRCASSTPQRDNGNFPSSKTKMLSFALEGGGPVFCCPYRHVPSTDHERVPCPSAQSLAHRSLRRHCIGEAIYYFSGVW